MIASFMRNRRWWGGAGLAVFGPMALHPWVLADGRRVLVVMSVCNLCGYLAGAGAHESDRAKRDERARQRAQRLR